MSIKSMSMGLLVAASLLCAAPFTAAAQEDEGMSAEQFVQSLHFRNGTIEVPEAKARFNLDGDFYAIEDICTHDGGELTGGIIEGHEIECPRHGARFDIRTGAVLCPPAYEPTAKFPVRVEDGIVYTRDDR